MKTTTSPTTPIHAGILAASFALAFFMIANTVNADMLTRQLEEGDSGADVSSLQTFLGQDRTIYPQGLVTGYFGSLTKSAVSNFQARNDIPTVGRVGPVTLIAINAKMGGNSGADKSAPRIMGVTPTPGSTSASIQWTASEQASGMVYYSTTWPSMTDTFTDATIGGSVAMIDTLQRVAQNVSLTGLQPSTMYYYVIYSRDASGNVQLTWPATFRTTN